MCNELIRIYRVLLQPPSLPPSRVYIILIRFYRAARQRTNFPFAISSRLWNELIYHRGKARFTPCQLRRLNFANIFSSPPSAVPVLANFLRKSNAFKKIFLPLHPRLSVPLRFSSIPASSTVDVLPHLPLHHLGEGKNSSNGEMHTSPQTFDYERNFIFFFFLTTLLFWQIQITIVIFHSEGMRVPWGWVEQDWKRETIHSWKWRYLNSPKRNWRFSDGIFGSL